MEPQSPYFMDCWSTAVEYILGGAGSGDGSNACDCDIVLRVSLGKGEFCGTGLVRELRELAG